MPRTRSSDKSYPDISSSSTSRDRRRSAVDRRGGSRVEAGETRQAAPWASTPQFNEFKSCRSDKTESLGFSKNDKEKEIYSFRNTGFVAGRSSNQQVRKIAYVVILPCGLKDDGSLFDSTPPSKTKIFELTEYGMVIRVDGKGNDLEYSVSWKTKQIDNWVRGMADHVFMHLDASHPLSKGSLHWSIAYRSKGSKMLNVLTKKNFTGHDLECARFDGIRRGDDYLIFALRETVVPSIYRGWKVCESSMPSSDLDFECSRLGSDDTVNLKKEPESPSLNHSFSAADGHYIADFGPLPVASGSKMALGALESSLSTRHDGKRKYEGDEDDDVKQMKSRSRVTIFSSPPPADEHSMGEEIADKWP